MKQRLAALLGLALFLGAWELAPLLTPGAHALLPVPSQLPGAFWREFQNGVWLACVGASLSHYLIGLGVGVALGVAAGVATGVLPPLEWMTAWITRILRPIPGLAWIPFAILWFGVEEKAAVFIIAIGVFWIVYFSAHGAIRNVDRDLIEVAAAFGFRTSWEKLVKVQFPASLPGILVGVRTSLGQAWMAVVAAELFGVAGLGQRMNQASSLLATDIVVVYMLTMAALYGLIDMAFIFAQSRLLTWKA
ncbi:ABC transporter permease [Methylosinus sp. Sm6]|uniref:ABC transporter permease n=1 Tax=Methylosinus sp. Sm6 TaxID=2866948 RepID=UPI001C99D885|nr:ABC transporter permease [Methylosinus sp. Sm6]MBY6243073.1 ABC transporter permease [Methylosinus sp. Sm6]